MIHEDPYMPFSRALRCIALMVFAALVSACANQTFETRTASIPTETIAPSELLPFASPEGFARLARSQAKAGFAALANQFEAQYNGAFCGPTSAAIVLNALSAHSDKLPRDTTRLRPEDLTHLPSGSSLIIPRYTQDSVIDKGPKTRAQVLGEPVSIEGQAVKDFGYQLRQLGAMLQAHGLSVSVVVADALQTERAIRAELSEALSQNGHHVLVNFLREAAGQRGGGHISPLGAYDAASDSFLVLDVNPAVSGWVWMPTSTLVRGMKTRDQLENRGYLVLRAAQ